jgi:hypothetical protein
LVTERPGSSCDIGTVAVFWKNFESDSATLWVSAGLDIHQGSSHQLDEKNLLPRSVRQDVQGATVIGWGYRPTPPPPVATSEVPHDAIFIAARMGGTSPGALNAMAARDKPELNISNPSNVTVLFLEDADLKVTLDGKPLITLDQNAHYIRDFFHTTTTVATFGFLDEETQGAPMTLRGNWFDPTFFVGVLGNNSHPNAALVYSLKQGCFKHHQN